MVSDVTGNSEFQTFPTPLHCDNRAAEMWTRNPHHHARQKHIDRSGLSIRELVNQFKIITIRLIPTREQLADCFTKSLALPAFTANVEKIMQE